MSSAIKAMKSLWEVSLVTHLGVNTCACSQVNSCDAKCSSLCLFDDTGRTLYPINLTHALSRDREQMLMDRSNRCVYQISDGSTPEEMKHLLTYEEYIEVIHNPFCGLFDQVWILFSNWATAFLYYVLQELTLKHSDYTK